MKRTHLTKAEKKRAARRVSRRNRIRREMDVDRRFHTIKLGMAAEVYVLQKGTPCVIQHEPGAEWLPDTLRSTLTLHARRVINGYAIYRYRGLSICVSLNGGPLE